MFYEEEQLNLFGHDTWSGKTYPEHSHPTEAKTSRRSSKKSSKSASRMPMCKCVYRIRDGQNPGAIILKMDDGALLGEFTMHSFGESPKDVVESRLSQILEDSPHPRFSLSAKACQGILNRANRTGKKMPEVLERALLNQSLALSKSEENVVGVVKEPFHPVGCDVYSFAVSGDKTVTLTASSGSSASHSGPTVMIPKVYSSDCMNFAEKPDVYQTLQAKPNGGQSLNYSGAVRVRYIVRRVTVLECERLQGYPDGWTDIGDWVDSKGKKHKAADSPRYKALGNSIALPYWKVLLKRISAQYDRDATMASLFDGIGGFPFLWEQINGKGSCLWASEIEEFPMAVTKERFGNIE